MNKTIPALHGTTNSAILAAHLNALHSVRKAFVESECEHIKQALLNKIRTSEQTFQTQNVVFYKRENGG